MIVSSHADEKPVGFGTQDAPPPPAKKKPTPKAKTQSEINKRSDEAANKNNQSQPTPTNSPTPVDPAPTVTSNTAVTGVARPVYVEPAYVPPPLGNLTVITYLNNPTKPGFQNERIGGVKVDVKRTTGQNFCANRKNTTRATTNSTQYNKAKQLVHGTANFLECNTGEYTVTLIGRSGYTPVKGTATKKTVTVNDDSTTTVKFVLNKKTSKKN